MYSVLVIILGKTKGVPKELMSCQRKILPLIKIPESSEKHEILKRNFLV